MQTHQIVFRTSRSPKTTVSCFCRARIDRHTRRYTDGEFCEPMEAIEGENLFQTYNRPENHWAPFTDKDKLKT